MNIIKSFLFWLLINAWGAIIPIVYSSVFFTNSSKTADRGALAWSRFSLWMLKKICKIDHQVFGLENLPDAPFIVACKHQSMWETIVMHLVFNRPVYAYKKELTLVPFYGWFLRKMSGIKIDRKGGAKALKGLIKQAKHYVDKKRVIVIFPQGTRVPVGASTKDYPYHSGIAALYLNCNVVVVPAALNSGLFWPKHKARKYAGKITLEFLPPIETGLKKEEFMRRLEEATEAKSNELCQSAKVLEQ